MMLRDSLHTTHYTTGVESRSNLRSSEVDRTPGASFDPPNARFGSNYFAEGLPYHCPPPYAFSIPYFPLTSQLPEPVGFCPPPPPAAPSYQYFGHSYQVNGNSGYCLPVSIRQPEGSYKWNDATRGNASLSDLQRQAVQTGGKRGRRHSGRGQVGYESNDLEDSKRVPAGSLECCHGGGTGTLSEIVKKASEKNQLTNPEFWKKYPDITTMSMQTEKSAIVEILENFAAAHKKQVFLFQRLKANILRNLKDYTAPDLSAVCHSFVVLGFLHQDFVVAMAPRVVSTAHLCTAAELTRLLDAYASLRCSNPEPIRVIIAETLKRLQHFEISDLITHASSFARLNLHNHRFFTLISERMLDIEAESVAAVAALDDDRKNSIAVKLEGISEHLGPSSLTSLPQDNENNNLFKSPLASTIAPPTDSPDTLLDTNEALKSVARPRFCARDLTLAAYSFAKLGFHFPSVFKFISRHAKIVIRDFTAHQIQMVAVAFQRAGVRDVELFQEMSVQAQRRMAQFNAESVALLLRSYSLFDIRDEALFTRVVAQLPRLILTFRPLDVATTLNAFARLNIASPALMAIVVPHILEEQSKFKASDLQSVLHACAKLGSVDVHFLELFCKRCDLTQLSPGQLTLIASDLPKLGFKDIRFLLNLQEALKSKVDYLNVTLLAQILAGFLLLELFECSQFVVFMQYLSTQIRSVWDANHKYASTHRSSNQATTSPLAPGATAALCLAELSVISFFTPEASEAASSPSGIPCRLLPVHPSMLLNRLLACQKTTGRESDQKSSENHHSGSSAIDLEEPINVIRAAMQSLPGLSATIEDDSSFCVSRRCSSGCVFGTLAGNAERETELGLEEIASTLRSLGGIKGIKMYSPPEEVHDKIDDYTPVSSLFTAPIKHVVFETTQSSLVTNSSLRLDGPATGQNNECPIVKRELTRHDSTDNSSTEVVEVAEVDNTSDTSGEKCMEPLPYHTFLSIPQSIMPLLKRFLPGHAAQESSATRTGPTGGKASDVSTFLFPDTVDIVEEEGGAAASDGGVSSFSGSVVVGRQRARSQSDSILYERALYDIDSSEHDSIQSLENYFLENEKSKAIDLSTVTKSGIPSVQENSIQDHLRAYSRSHADLIKNDARGCFIILWGGSLHFWNNAILSHLKDKNDLDEEVTEVGVSVKQAIELHKRYVFYLTPLARLQLRIFSSLKKSDNNIELYLVPHYIWHALSSTESRLAFLAALLLDSTNSVTERGYTKTSDQFDSPMIDSTVTTDLRVSINDAPPPPPRGIDNWLPGPFILPHRRQQSPLFNSGYAEIFK